MSNPVSGISKAQVERASSAAAIQELQSQAKDAAALANVTKDAATRSATKTATTQTPVTQTAATRPATSVQISQAAQQATLQTQQAAQKRPSAQEDENADR